MATSSSTGGIPTSPTINIPTTSSSTGVSPSDTLSVVPSVGASTNGPAEVAFKYCFPSKFPNIATDTPCYSMDVLNQACFYGPSVFVTATATPTSTASPQKQQECYCDSSNGTGSMYFQYLQGCASCFRLHGALGSYGAYGGDAISILSSAYCEQKHPTINFGAFLTSFQIAEQITYTADAATDNVLGTSTDVSLYFTTSFTSSSAFLTFPSAIPSAIPSGLPSNLPEPGTSGLISVASDPLPSFLSTSTSATTSNTSTPSLSSSNKGLSPGAKIGIGIGVGIGSALLLALLSVLLLWRLRPKKKRKRRRNIAQGLEPVVYNTGIAVDDDPGVAVESARESKQFLS